MVITIASIAFLIIGLILRVIPTPVEPKAKGPIWKARMAFETKRDFALYVTGSILIGLGGLFLFISVIFRLI